VPADQPLRTVRRMTDDALRTLTGAFAKLCADTGRPSIPPEQLLRALLLQYLYGTERAVAYGLIAVQPAVPLVRGAWDGRGHTTIARSRVSVELPEFTAFFSNLLT
jgi:hypothetical protein